MHLQGGFVLGPDLASELVIGIGLDPRVTPDLEVAVGILQVEYEQAALRPLAQIAGLAPGAVERDLDLALVIQEPDLGQLRQAVVADRGQRSDLGVEEIAVGDYVLSKVMQRAIALSRVADRC